MTTAEKLALGIIIGIGTILVLMFCCDAQADTVSEIIAEAMRSNTDTKEGQPLPLAASWRTGTYAYTYEVGDAVYLTPQYQVSLIEAGHHWIPSLGLIASDTYYADESALSKIAAWELPITIVATQIEQALYNDYYKNLADNINPNVLTTTGNIESKLTPFPPVSDYWDSVGYATGTTAIIDILESIYPSPPMIKWLSNNEPHRLIYNDADSSQRFVDLYTDKATLGIDSTHSKFASGWWLLYGKLFDGLKRGFSESAWQNNTDFIGHNAVYRNSFARYAGWQLNALINTDRIDAWAYAFDGTSTAYYQYYTTSMSDYKVYSNQVEEMNMVFALNEIYKDKPDFWHEISLWDGDRTKREWYESIGQTWTAERYKGWLQYGMWLSQPRVIRDFRMWAESQEYIGEDYLEALMAAVDTIYEDDMLKRFWRKGELVENTDHQHPYQTQIPAEYASVNRWYLLDTDLDEAWPWDLTTEIYVYSLARVLGTTPNREWLIYAHSPRGARSDVVITIPDYPNETVTIDVPLEGGFFHYIETPKKTVFQNGMISRGNLY